MEINEEELRRRESILVNECDGIQPMFDIFYIFSINYSANSALAALDRFWLARFLERDDSVVVSAAQEALTHSAALSRFFWPSPKSKFRELNQARAKKLRAAFSLSEDSELSDRKLRDALEHYDERLDYFLMTNTAGEMFPTPVVESYKYSYSQTQKFFKLVDPEQMIFVLFGERYAFGQIMIEVSEIFSRSEEMTKAQHLG